MDADAAAYAMGISRVVPPIGGLTGLFLAALAVDGHLTRHLFVIAMSLHHGGGMVMAISGAALLVPKISGRLYPERLAKLRTLSSLPD